MTLPSDLTDRQPMKQRRQVVAREVVDGLLDAYLASPKYRDRRPCSVFKPDEMRAALRSLPDHAEGLVDYNRASEVLNQFECHKLTGGCNVWTPWMRQRLRDTKRPLDDPR